MASEDKNYKNFSHIVCHQENFWCSAEWHFFATSHGKNACDGIGDTIKQEAAKARLQAVTTGHILAPRRLYDWGYGNIQKVKLFISSEDVLQHDQLKSRYLNAEAVCGTHSHYCVAFHLLRKH